MEGLQLDFEQLVRETYGHNPRPTGSTGIFYRILHQNYTYQIQAVASKQMQDDGPSCPLGERDVHCFPTPSFELAQVVRDSVVHKRFPKMEDIFYNIGDPAENWWMINEDNSLKILFRSYGLQESQNRGHVLLGPLGDPQVAAIRFQRLKECLQSCFPLSQMKVSPKIIQFATFRSKEGMIAIGFEQFRNLLCKGELSEEFAQQIKQKASPTIFHYLNELAILRQFWIQVYQLLSK